MSDDAVLSLTYDSYTEITLSNTEYTLIATPGIPYIVKNKSGYPIYLAMNDDRSTLSGDANQQLLGGLTFEILTDDSKYVWVRAAVANSVVTIRPVGTMDPSTDVASLGQTLNSYINDYNNHKRDIGNPHNVTKDQVGLGVIPNAIDSNPNTDNDQILATTRLTHLLKEDIDKHIADTDNPHSVTKEQVGLSNVDNLATADSTVLEDCLETVKDKFVTPAAAYRIARLATVVAYSTKPQLVVSSPMGTRRSDWMTDECDEPCACMIQSDATHVLIRSGLSVTYGIDHKSRVSDMLETNLSQAIPVDTDGTYYVYVDINIEGYIHRSGVTTLPPIYDTDRKDRPGDFFNIATCIMYDSNNNAIRRVYLGRVVVTDRSISSIVPVPLGDRYTVPLGADLVLSGRYLLDNPFLTDRVQVTPEVLFRDSFGPTMWNDQIGVLGAVHPLYPNTVIVVQCGQMGFLCSGRESGCPFGGSFTTVTTNLRTRVVMHRQW